MRKILIGCICMSTFALADQCTYSYDRMVDNIKKFHRANELKMTGESVKILRMIKYYNNNVLLTCPKESTLFKYATEVKEAVK